jgi:DNA-binding CsgD family transcriptional regulator
MGGLSGEEEMTAEETIMLSALCAGRTLGQIMGVLDLCENDILALERSIFRKLGVRTRGDAIAKWIEQGKQGRAA